MKYSFPLHRKLFLSHFLVTFLVSSAIGVFFYVTARDSLLDQLRARLSSSAALISREIDANSLHGIRQERDITLPDYMDVLQRLRQMRRSNRDIAFLYVMRRDSDGRVRFVVDSDESEQQALPGREYSVPTPSLMRGFLEQSADRDMITDEWGTFISGYAPILNGRGEYLVGIDMRADEVAAKLQRIHQAGIGGVVTALVCSWLLGWYMSRRFRKPIEDMIEQCQAISAGDFDRKVEVQQRDELDSLLVAINEMTADLRRSRERRQQEDEK